MASPPAIDVAKKPSSTRTRKMTPRSRAKRTAVAEKKAPTPRRRASPRNAPKAEEAAQENKQEKSQPQKKTKSPVAEVVVVSVAPVNEEAQQQEKKSQQETELLIEKTEPIIQETAAKEEVELPLAQDTQLRRTYLQRIYRQLQSTHLNEDDTILRQLATNVEMEVCQKAATRSQYVAAMDREIHKLMQFEMEQANASTYTNNTQRFGNTQAGTPTQPTVSGEMQGGYSQHQISQSRSYEYAQALAKAQEQEQANGISRNSTPRQSMNGDASFQSLMGNQSQGYTVKGMQQQQNTPYRGMNMQNIQQTGNQYYPTSSMAPTSQSFSIQSNNGEVSGQGVPRNMMEAHQLNNYQVQSPYTNQPGPMRPQHRVSNLQEFSAQIQHLDKHVLIELLWNQRGALAQWQQKTRQLENQIAALQTATVNMGSPGFNSSYSSPMVSGNNFVNPNISAEAEIQRARERSNSRNMQQQIPHYSYMQQSNESSPAFSQAGGNGMNWGENAQVYWDKVRILRATYAEQLRIAKRALAHNAAPPNTIYSVKAQSVMSNIGLVIDILDEQPTSAQPRKFNVLTSIERFIQMTVVPIVRKVQSSYVAASQAAVTSGSLPAVTSTVATYAPGVSSLRDGTAGQGTQNQFAGTIWSPSNSIFSQGDTPRQSITGAFAEMEAKSPASGYEGNGTGSRGNTPTQLMDGMAAVGNSPANNSLEAEYKCPEYTQLSTENGAKVTNQPEGSHEMFGAPLMTPKGSSLPAIETRLSTITEMRLPSVSPGGNARESSSKVMEGGVDDTLHEFSELDGLEFDEPVVEGSSLVKENNPSNILRKRGIEDV